MLYFKSQIYRNHLDSNDMGQLKITDTHTRTHLPHRVTMLNLDNCFNQTVGKFKLMYILMKNKRTKRNLVKKQIKEQQQLKSSTLSNQKKNSSIYALNNSTVQLGETNFCSYRKTSFTMALGISIGRGKRGITHT